MAQGGLKLDQLKNVLSDIQKALECPICLEMVRKPFKLCARGHLVCVSCLSTIQSCPTCKGELQQENPSCIQSLLECLPRSCRYTADGCKVMITDGDDHEKFCGFRRVKCKSSSCARIVMVKNMHEHLASVHAKTFMIKTCNVSNNLLLPNYETATSFAALYVFVTDRLFCISYDQSDDRYFKIAFKSFPVGKPDCDFYAKVTFENENIGYMYTLKASPVEDNEGGESKNTEADCMKIPKNMLPNFVDDNDRLCYSIIVFKL